MAINDTMRELAQYIRMSEEIANTIDGLKDEIKAYMTDTGMNTLASDEHKAIYKEVESKRIDTTALKQDIPDIAAKYTKTSTTKRFTFV